MDNESDVSMPTLAQKGTPLVDPVAGGCAQLDTKVDVVKA
jgi:hypothetical protein